MISGLFWKFWYFFKISNKITDIYYYKNTGYKNKACSANLQFILFSTSTLRKIVWFHANIKILNMVYLNYILLSGFDKSHGMAIDIEVTYRNDAMIAMCIGMRRA